MVHEQDGSVTFKALTIFERFLTVWVLLCMAVGAVVGYFLPAFSEWLQQATIVGINAPLAVLLWFMIFPMLLKVDFVSIKRVVLHPKGVLLTCSINFGVQPFVVFGLSVLFFRVIYKSLLSSSTANDYIAGSVLLAAAPCTAMVFVWSRLCGGDPGYTLVQVAINDIIVLFTYVPTVVLLLGVSDVTMPWDVVVYSVIVFVLVPIIIATCIRIIIIRRLGIVWFTSKVIQPLETVTSVALIATVFLIFVIQGELVVEKLGHIGLIAIPMLIQSFVVWMLTFAIAYLMRLPFEVAAPASMISTSNFFELAVAVAISVFGPESGVTLATIVGVLVEIPVMLSLVRLTLRFTDRFVARYSQKKNPPPPPPLEISIPNTSV
jgi:ACR3 family arsenite transporter